MDKIAQKRRLRNKLREMVNAPTEKLMGAYSPQFVELMEQLREIDDSIREQAAELKNLLKLAKTNFNRREYMTAITYLGQFHDKLEAIDNELSKLGSAVDIKHHEFLFGDVDQDHIDYLINQLSPKLEKRRLSLQQQLKQAPVSKKRASLEKEAGLADWWSNLTTDRGRTLAAWEKRFPKESKELKRQTENIIKRSSSLLDFLVTVFKVLASLRSTRSLEEYLKIADKFKQKYRVYDATFAIFYDTYVKKFVEMQKQLATKPTTDAPIPPDESAPGTIQTPAPDMELGPMPPTGQQVPAPEVFRQTAPMPEAPRGFPVPFHARDPKDVPEHVKAWMKQQEEEKKREQAVLAFAPTMYSPIGHVSMTPSSSHNTLKDQEIELSHIPDTDEKTMVSPTLALSHRDKPIQVSVEHPPTLPEITPRTQRKSHEHFLQQLNKLADASPFIMAAELIKYANSIKDEEPEASEQLLQLSKNILAEGS